MGETYHEYLKDESKMRGAADSISFPESEAQIGSILQVMREKRMPVTIQGGKTGVVGSAVPSKGHIMNLSHMNQVKSFCIAEGGEAFLKVEPGITLNELRKAIDRLATPEAFFWPPDPSESTATVGGIASTDAVILNWDKTLLSSMVNPKICWTFIWVEKGCMVSSLS